jgi:outer membrane lipase/esterase
LFVAAAVLVTTLAEQASASSTYSGIYAFGDSLSDVGNVYAATSTLTGGKAPEPAPPYYQGQFSNGPVWVQDLSQMLGLGPLSPSFIGGNDYAWGGATVLGNNPPPVQTLKIQVRQFLSTGPLTLPATALYAFSIGTGDLLGVLHNPDPNRAAPLATAAFAAQTVATEVARLAERGAKNFLVMDVPNLGLTPEIRGLDPVAASDARSLSFAFNGLLNQDLGHVLTKSKYPIRVFFLDANRLVDDLVLGQSRFGLTDVTDPCYVGPLTGGGSVCSNPNSYLFWDEVNLTAVGHEALAKAAYGLVAATSLFADDGAPAAAAPEASTWAMALIGFSGLALAGLWRTHLARLGLY